MSATGSAVVTAAKGAAKTSTNAPSAETARLLEILKAWSEHGWIRRLDNAFATFTVDLSPEAPPAVVMAAALVAHMEGRGHSCLLIDNLLTDPEGLLSWAPDAAAEFRAVAAALPTRPEDWLDALRNSPLVWVDDWPSKAGQADRNQPLVLRGAKLYLRRYWRYERQVAARILQRAAALEAVDEAKAREWLDRLFPAAGNIQASAPRGAPKRKTPVDWQKVACAVALRGRLSVITGGPGTGKTHTAARLLALLFAIDSEPQRLRVALAAPTGKAAARLKQTIDAALQSLKIPAIGQHQLADLVSSIGAARTLHSLLGSRPDTRAFRFNATNPLQVDVVIVDEASMIHLEMMAALLEALPPQARLILLGDKDQLASVEAGAVLGELCRGAELGRYRPDTAAFIESMIRQRLPAEELSNGAALAQQTVMLRASRRFAGRIGELALAANDGDIELASALLKSTADDALMWLSPKSAGVVVKLAVQGRAGAGGGYGGKGGYLERVKRRPKFEGDLFARQGFDEWVVSVLDAFERFRLLCAVHEGEWGTKSLNLAIERALAAKGSISKRNEWYEGRPIMVTRNESGLGVFNGDVGVVLSPMNASVTGAPPRAYFLDGRSFRSVGVSRLAHVETAFALTVHKSQGSEFDHTLLVLPKEPSRVLTRELVYTGISRARSAFTLVTGRTQAFAEALGQRTRRSSGLLELLDAAAIGPGGR